MRGTPQDCTPEDWELQAWTQAQYRGAELSLTSGNLAAMAKGQVHQKGQAVWGCKGLQLTLTMSP